MQSTGQASTQAVSLVPIQGSAITYAIGVFSQVPIHNTAEREKQFIGCQRLSAAPNWSLCRLKSVKQFSQPRDSVPAFCPPPRRSRKRCCPSSTNRSFSTVSRRRFI